MLYAFTMTLEAAEEFYRRVEQYDAITSADRNAILAQMVQEGLIQGVTATNRSREEYVQDLQKNFSVLDTSEGFGGGGQ